MGEPSGTAVAAASSKVRVTLLGSSSTSGVRHQEHLLPGGPDEQYVDVVREAVTVAG